MASRYEQLMADSRHGHEEALRCADQFLRQGKVVMACDNLMDASKDAMMAGMSEWRLGAGDPTQYFETVIADAARLLECIYKIEHPVNRLAINEGLFNGIYAHLLLGREGENRLWEACRVSSDERVNPDAKACFHVEDWLIIELIHGGELPAEWGAFLTWLDGKKGTRNHSATMRTYAALIEAAREGDRDGVVKAVRQAEVNYGKRRNISVTWGGDPVVREQIVDYRLACAVRTAERIGGEVVAGVETVHRWRWG